jgi:hypothetical protein
MLSIKERIKLACKRQKVSISSVLMLANIQSGDFYQAVNGKKPFFKSWRHRIAEALKLREEDLFPEYQKEGDTSDE